MQTLENNPAFIHGGPFANIAHGCNSVLATTTALKLADYVVTEAGFGADLGAEKFFDIKCRKAGLKPDAAVIVATVRALKMHGGVPRDGLKEENVAALEKGFANLERHLENLRGFGVPVVVSVNRFSADTAGRACRLKELCAGMGVEAVIADHWAQGERRRRRTGPRRRQARRQRQGGLPLSLSRRDAAARQDQDDRPEDLPGQGHRLRRRHREPARRIAKGRVRPFPGVHRQDAIQLHHRSPTPRARRTIMCSAVREIRLSAGAEFIVAVCGEIMTMPGLPRVPAANSIELTEDGRITGLF